jgi:uncharacterized protein with PIN domain
LKFISDGMLGKLTRWLRMLGQDVEYSNDMEDTDLLTAAKKENRILLTRDFELYQRALGKGIDAFYLEGSTGEAKLAELAKRYGVPLEIHMSSSRCPKCNAPVKPVPRKNIEGLVEKSTFENYKDFWQCTKCGQMYWQGAHWTKITRSLETAKMMLKKEEKES